ncbi:transposase [Streptomyces sp. NPDC088360]|uniref:transposase n=1 Tax=Streptomyces sp. NPDC088360 TaxID=3154515 RepID=UPI003450C32C
MDDDLWVRLEPLLPPWPEKSPGPRPVEDRLCPQAILYVLHNGTARQLLPRAEPQLQRLRRSRQSAAPRGRAPRAWTDDGEE